MSRSERIPDITSMPLKKMTQSGNLLPGANLAGILSQVVGAADEWVKVVQEESTKRDEISAWEAVQRERIVSHREILIRGLDLTFDERRENFRRLFDSLESAMKMDDASTVASVLESITELAKSSPFKDLQSVELAVDQFKRPGQTWNV